MTNAGSERVKATTGGNMLCLGPQVVALIIFFTRAFLLMEPIYTFSIEISSGS